MLKNLSKFKGHSTVFEIFLKNYRINYKKTEWLFDIVLAIWKLILETAAYNQPLTNFAKKLLSKNLGKLQEEAAARRVQLISSIFFYLICLIFAFCKAVSHEPVAVCSFKTEKIISCFKFFKFFQKL
jgi:hypothetical protein